MTLSMGLIEQAVALLAYILCKIIIKKKKIQSWILGSITWLGIPKWVSAEFVHLHCLFKALDLPVILQIIPAHIPQPAHTSC